MIKKPWGAFETLAENENVTVKIIWVDKGEKNSLQIHKNRSEYWFVIKGKIIAHVNGEMEVLEQGFDITVKANEKHRFEGLEEENIILEICRGVFDEDDIVRLEDDYGRVFYGDARDD